ncbi:histidine kinase [Curtobacterium flaccumfaciens pv. flaccumfaciens]|uniref:sensor histidine kinase n=1 Tax=Curtobacterium flaccumfaciens TaxID=2035 RepID=UPI001599CA0B|nr:histidine kinase [Curtobacterium flaccumfaciens]MCS5509728.1 histidine kinase [Curtobacterium flaccumfaciens pv. flaccumfaciens]MCX2787449.1 histidine kinase [Curtobacterium flaccumfaciens pv. flaccumfaciens]QKS86570.1 sensor histidine kinase [Curtobacterium flaccumfaciens pv. flaccumfaciens]
MAPAEHDALRAPAEPAAQRARRVDVFVALGTAVVALGLLLGLPPLDALEPDGAALALRAPAPFTLAWSVLALGLVVQSAALVAARRAPRTVLIVVAALPVVVAALAPESFDVFGLTALPVVVAVVLAALRVTLARLWPTLLVAGALVAAGSAVLSAGAGGAFRGDFSTGLAGSLGQGVLQAIGAVGLPLLVTLLVQSRREVRVARTAEASAVNREQDALVDAAVSRERAAMARELHDIAAHHLSGIALMAAVIDRQIDADPERAHEGARQVREQSTAVLEDLRRLVGLLRDDAPAERAVETVAGIVDLAERARFRSDVRLDVLPGDRPLADGVGPLAQLAAYRTVQEALANAALHAPSAPCTVTIDDRDATRVVIRVENAPATVPAAGTSPSGGNGLRGMRERADLVGARLQTGPTATGGWLVELALGREAPAAPAQAADGTGVVA